ncbi:TonB-dependent receptor [Luteimonas sp. SDU101]|uniref:TonB-dependent receptor n=1 Tax=Luteimonas sp. SDU101 TaxID=3422593 RepID=UPI003EBCC9C0
MRRTLLSLLCSTASIVAMQTAAAEAGPDAADTAAGQAQATTLDAVNVTARKRSESIQDVPVAITSLTPEQLEKNMATDLAKIGEVAPQVIIGRASNGTGGFLTIRGISSATSDAGLDQSVSVSVDGVPMSRGRVINSTVYDLAQVEVLSGPQALFFGKNSPAGAISLRTKDPTDVFEGYARIGYEAEAAERYLEAAVSGPLTSTLKGRIAVRAASMDGWIENVAEPIADPIRPDYTARGANSGSTGPDGDNVAARLTLLWQPADDFTANLKLTHDVQTMNAMNAYVELYCSGDQTQPSIAGIPMPQADCEKNRRKAEGGLPAEYAVNWPYGNGGVPDYRSEYTLGSLGITKDFSNHSLVSTTGLYSQEIVGSNNADYTEFALLWSSQQEDYRLFTQEFRLSSVFDGPFNYQVGLFYEKSSRDWFNAADLFHGGFNTQAQNWTTFETAASVESESLSGFAQLQWNFNENWELSGGARYTRDDKDGEFWNESIGVSGMNLYPVGQVARAKFSASNVSPEMTLRWKPDRDQTFYFGYKTGYKAGGLSNGAILNATADQSNLEFDAEEAAGFEVGYKATLLDNTLRLDVSAYRYDYEGLQVATFNQNTISFTIGNAAEARTEGVGGSLQWLATDRLSFNGNIGYNRSRYTDYRNAQCYSGQTTTAGCIGGVQDLSGEYLVRAPKLTANLGVDYRAYVGSWFADFSLGGSYSSSYQTQPDNHPGAMQESFWRLNAAVHLTPADERYRFSLIGRNLTDEYYMVASASSPGGPATQHTGTFARPREIAAQFEYRWF